MQKKDMARCTAGKQLVEGGMAVQIRQNANSPVNPTCFCRWMAVQMKDMAECTAGKQLVVDERAVQITKT